MRRKTRCITGMMGIATLTVLYLTPVASWAKTVEYDLTVGYKTVNYTGKQRKAMAINGRIPGPVLSFTEGDRAVIRVHNKMDVETSIHWHGILLPNQYDGVPYVTTMPVLPGKTHTFTFDLRQTGTYWYHSHTNLQEQRGMYGAIVIYPKEPKVKVDHDWVLVLSDWTDENPIEVLRTLKRGSEWYSIKKGTAQSWDRVISHGAVKQRLKQSFKRMPPMDLSDVYYDRFLVNGQPEVSLDNVKPGDTVRLRVINGSTATYFNLQFAGGPLQLINADGKDVDPLLVKRLRIAIAETYDFLLTLPAGGAYELRATAQDGSGYGSAFIGRGEKIPAPAMPQPDLFKMMGMGAMDGKGKMKMKGPEAPAAGDESGQVMKRGMKGMDKMTNGTILEGYGALRSTVSTRLPDANPTREIVLELTGNMDRYVWSFNNRTLSEADKILIHRGENVRFKLINKTMMHHPMHLHGHFFRVLNGQGDYSPLKHTVDVGPLQTTVIEFLADEDKDWFFHCHILYHLASGMARVIHYEGSEIDPSLAAAKKKDTFELDDDHFFVWGDASVMTHMNDGNILISNIRNGLELKWDWDWNDAYEIEPSYVRYVNRLFQVYAGGDFSDEESRGVLGLRYILPFYLESDLRVNDEGRLRLEVGSDIQLFPRLFFRWFANTDGEWRYGLEYLVTKRFSAVGNYDSDYGAGLGIRILF